MSKSGIWLRIRYFPDDEYKDDAYLLTVSENNHRGYSLVDMI